MSKLRNGFVVAAAVGAAAGGIVESQPTAHDQVVEAQQQIIYNARHNAAHPSNNPDVEYSALLTSQDAKAIGEAKKLTARRVAKLSFNQAFNQASDIGGLVIDVSGTTQLPVKTVLSESLPQSTVSALEKKNIHFTYDAVDCNPIVMEAQNGRPAEGWIPLSLSNKPVTTPRTYAINGGKAFTWSEYKTSNGTDVWSVNSESKPNINADPLQLTSDGTNVMLEAAVNPGKTGDHITSASFSLVNPHDAPKGVSIGKSHLVATNHGEEVTARFNDPSNLSLHGQVEVQLNAVESNGAVATDVENIPYAPSLKRPN